MNNNNIQKAKERNREEFEEKFLVNGIIPDGIPGKNLYAQDILAFLSQALDSQKEKINKIHEKELAVQKKEIKVTLLEVIEGMGVYCGSGHWDKNCDCDGYNQALNDLKAKIEEL